MEKSDAAWRALCAFAANPHRSDDPRERWEIVTTKSIAKRTRKRKVTLDQAMKQANKAGIAVSVATINPDGSASLQLGEAAQQSNPWDSVQ